MSQGCANRVPTSAPTRFPAYLHACVRGQAEVGNAFVMVSTRSRERALTQVALAYTQRLAGDTAGAKVTAQQVCSMLEQVYRDQPDNSPIAAILSQAYAAIGEKDSALKLAERAITAFAER